MSAIAAIKLSTILATLSSTSSATVSVDKTYDPEGKIAPGVTRWVDRSGGIAVGYPALTLSVRPPNKTSRMYRVLAKLTSPTLETVGNAYNGITPGPTKAYELMGQIEALLPERSTLAERTAFLSQLHSLFLTTIQASDAAPSDSTGSPLAGAVLNFDPPW
jgi:hypothetical protein